MNVIYEPMAGGAGVSPANHQDGRVVTPGEKRPSHDNALHLAQYVLKTQYEPHFSDTKSGKNRSVPIDDDLTKALLKAASMKKSERLFGYAYSAFRDAVDRMPKGQLTHVLRHSFASHFMMNGGNILVLQKLLAIQV